MTYQKFPNSKQLTMELNSNKLERIYLFLGEEEGEKDKIISKIVDMKIKNQDEKNYSTRRFHLENDEFQEAAEFALSGSMFSESKVCVMLNINSLKSKSEDKELLSEIITTLPDTNILIMTSPEIKAPAIINSKDLKNIKIVQFWRPFDNDISSYIITAMRKNGLAIDIAAVNHLIDLTGRDIKKIDEAIEIIIDSGEKSVTPGMIKEYINDSKDVSIFEFIDSLFQKDRNVFFQLAKVLDSGTHELVLLKLIMRQAELIEKYIYLIKDNLNSEAAMQEIGINPRNKKIFIDCAKRFSSESIKRIFPLIYKADQRIKSYNYSDNLASNPIFGLATEMLLDTPQTPRRGA